MGGVTRKFSEGSSANQAKPKTGAHRVMTLVPQCRNEAWVAVAGDGARMLHVLFCEASDDGGAARPVPWDYASCLEAFACRARPV